MAVAVDRANLLADQIIRSFKPLKDALIAIGILYSMKSVIKIGYHILHMRYAVEKKILFMAYLSSSYEKLHKRL